MFVLGVPILGTAKSKEGLQSPRKDCKVQRRTAKSNGVRGGLKSPRRIAKRARARQA